RAEDQPVAYRNHAAALYAPVRCYRGLISDRKRAGGAVAGQFPSAGIRQSLRLLLLAQPCRCRRLDLDPASDRLSDRLWHGAAAATMAGGGDDAGHRTVLDVVSDPCLCMDQHPAA